MHARWDSVRARLYSIPRFMQLSDPEHTYSCLARLCSRIKHKNETPTAQTLQLLRPPSHPKTPVIHRITCRLPSSRCGLGHGGLDPRPLLPRRLRGTSSGSTRGSRCAVTVAVTVAVGSVAMLLGSRLFVLLLLVLLVAVLAGGLHQRVELLLQGQHAAESTRGGDMHEESDRGVGHQDRRLLLTGQ